MRFVWNRNFWWPSVLIIFSFCLFIPLWQQFLQGSLESSKFWVRCCFSWFFLAYWCGHVDTFHLLIWIPVWICLVEQILSLQRTFGSYCWPISFRKWYSLMDLSFSKAVLTHCRLILEWYTFDDCSCLFH